MEVTLADLLDFHFEIIKCFAFLWYLESIIGDYLDANLVEFIASPAPKKTFIVHCQH
jgi:hypothetical protein